MFPNCTNCDSFRISHRQKNNDLNSNGSSDLRPLTLFRRVLPCPPALTSFQSKDGIKLFQEALSQGTMVNFFALVAQFRTQDEPAFCGISTLVMALNALEIDALRIWREGGPWRFFDESMLTCCRSLEDVKKKGITLTEWICLARCNGARIVEFFSGGGESLDSFRKLVIDCSKIPSCKRVLVASYSRKEFHQTGDGHFSPIVGYHAATDSTLILDVARFKYPPHWVKVEDLFKAMKRLDTDTNKPRGCVVLSPSVLHGTLVFTIRTNFDSWNVFNWFLKDLNKGFLSFDNCTTSSDGKCELCPSKGGLISRESIVRCFFSCMPDEVRNALSSYGEIFNFDTLAFRPRDHEQMIAKIQAEIEGLDTYKLVKAVLESLGCKNNPVISTAFLLAFSYSPCLKDLISKNVNCIRDIFEQLQDLSFASLELQQEVQSLANQFEIMINDTTYSS